MPHLANQSATAASLPMYRGRKGPPAYLPAIGTAAAISNNTLQSVGARAGTIEAWNSGAFNPWLGARGTLIAYGEGHTDGGNTNMYGFDLDTQLWSIIGENFIDTDQSGTPNNAAQSLTFADYSRAIGGNTPVAHHTYDSIMIVPPFCHKSVGAQGGLLVPNSEGCFYNGSWGTQYSHLFDFATQKWSRFSTNNFTHTGGNSLQGGADYDINRNKAYEAPRGPFQTNFSMLGIDTQSWSSSAMSGNATIQNFSIYNSVIYDAVRDVLLMTDNPGLLVQDMSSGTRSWKAMVLSGASLPSLSGIGMTYVPEIDKFALFSNISSPNTIYWLTPPTGNPVTGTWVVSTETFTGTILDNSNVNTRMLVYKRFRWLGQRVGGRPDTGIKCFSYFNGHTLPVYVIRSSLVN